MLNHIGDSIGRLDNNWYSLGRVTWRDGWR
jgi:hypothetical protein